MTYVQRARPSRSTVLIPHTLVEKFIAVGNVPGERISHRPFPNHSDAVVGNTIRFAQTTEPSTKISLLWRNHYPSVVASVAAAPVK